MDFLFPIANYELNEVGVPEKKNLQKGVSGQEDLLPPGVKRDVH